MNSDSAGRFQMQAQAVASAVWFSPSLKQTVDWEAVSTLWILHKTPQKGLASHSSRAGGARWKCGGGLLNSALDPKMFTYEDKGDPSHILSVMDARSTGHLEIISDRHGALM